MNWHFGKPHKVLGAKIKNFRLRRIFYTAVSTLGAKGITTLVSFISLPLTLNYLGKERYGMMMTIVSIFAIMRFGDLGLGYGLQNRLVEFSKEKGLLQKAISSTFFFLIIVAIGLCAVFVLIYPIIPWHKIFNVKSALATNEAGLSAAVFFICFTVSLPISIIQKIQGGFQEGYYTQFWMSGGSVLGLILLYAVIILEMGVPFIILAIYGANSFFLLLNFLNEFLRKRKELMPSWSLVNKEILKIVIRDGVLFTVVQILFLVLISSDNLIVSHILGPEKVVILIIGAKLIGVLVLPVNAIMGPALPALNDATENKDLNWIRQAFSKGIRLTLISTLVLGVVFFISANFVIRHWIGVESILSMPVLIAFVVFFLYSNMNTFFSYFMLSKQFLNKLVKIYSVAAIITLIVKVACTYFWGIPGLLIGGAVSLVLFFFIPSFLTITKKIR